MWYLALPILILLNAWWFPRIVGSGYFEWYLSNGVLISLSAGFLALVWDDMEERKGLLSANPVRYMAACFTVAGVLTFAMGTHLRSRPGSRTAVKAPVNLGTVWDQGVSAFLAVAVLLVTLGWTLVVAPLAYLTTLVAGAPARMALRGGRARSSLRESRGKLTLDEIDADLPDEGGLEESGGVDVSIGRKPFALTQALSALVLLLAKRLLL